MGKSPGKWLKTVLFGKKSSRSHSSEKLSKRDSAREAPKKAPKDKERWVLGEEMPQDQPPSSALCLEPLSVGAQKEQNALVQGQSKQTVTTGTDKSNISASVSTAMFATNEVTEKLTKSRVPEAVDSIIDADRVREESAAIKAQAAFRGYLARRAFRALRGLIRLQALVRGHLVRRQAVGSLRCLQAIIRLQALVRARRVRLSEQGLAIQKSLEQRRKQNCSRANELERKSAINFISNSNFQSEKLLANAFARQLLESVPKPNSLRIDCNPDKSNSGWIWLERWMSARPCDLSLQISNSPVLKMQKKIENLHLNEAEVERPKRGLRKASNSALDSVSNQLDIEAEKPKRGFRRVSKSTVDSGSDQLDVEAEKPKRNSRKGVNSTLDSVPDHHPEVEAEKVRRSLRKIPNSTVDSIADQPEVEAEKVKRSLRKISNSTVDSVSDQLEVEAEIPKRNWRKVSKSTLDSVSDQPSMQPNVVNIAPNDELAQHVPPDEFSFDQSCRGQETISVVQEMSTVQQATSLPESTTQDDVSQQRTESSVINGELMPTKHERVELSNRNESELSGTEQKIARRRSSFGSVKADHAENGSQGSPSIPSYMAATESAKAKLRGQASPRSSPDVQEKTSNSMRRFSLPASSNGKQNSVSPRPQRLLPQVQVTKGNSKSDRSLPFSKDATERVVQVDWRR
eukprot:Gb_18991 [translate_table: standard]